MDPAINVYAFDAELDKFARVLDLRGHSSHVVDLKFSPSEPRLLFSASWDSKVFIWDGVTGEKLRSLFHSYPPPQFVFNNPIKGLELTRSFVATVTEEDATVRLWDLRRGSEEDQIAPAQQLQLGDSFDDLQSVIFNRKGTMLAACGSGGRVALFRFREGGTRQWFDCRLEKLERSRNTRL